MRVVLVERADVVGPDLGDKPRPVIEEALAALGVELRLGATVQSIDRGGVRLGSGERRGGPDRDLGRRPARQSRRRARLAAHGPARAAVRVDAGLRADGATDVFAAGDVARAMADGRALHAHVLPAPR